MINDSHDTLPLIVGHRGDSLHAPENTLAAFQLALTNGADGVEFDVRLARDGVPVVIHDATLRRTGLRRETAVAALTSAELGEMDAGTWFNRRFPAHARDEYASERVPTLAQTLALLKNRARVIYVEMKCERVEEYAQLAAAVVHEIRAREVENRAVVKSFVHDAIAEVKRLAPDIRTAALFERKLSQPVITARKIIERAIECEADEISLQRTLLRRNIVEAAQARGLKTVVWTVDDPSRLRRARELSLHAIITNNPALMLAARARLSQQGLGG